MLTVVMSLFFVGMEPTISTRLTTAPMAAVVPGAIVAQGTLLAQATETVAEPGAVEAESDAADGEPADVDAMAEGAPPPRKLTFIEQLIQSGILLPIGLVVLFYAVFLAPERRRKAEEAKMMSTLKKNDRVVTIGGIHGTVAATSGESDIVTIKIDESSGTRIRVNRSAIAKVISETDSTTEKDKTEKGKDD